MKALRAVAGSLSWIARQCRLEEEGTASTLQGSVSRVVVKDLSDANRAVNWLKQTEDVGLLIHAIPLINLRTVSISDAALDLDRPDGSTQGGFMVGFTTSALHQQGSASTSRIPWSSHKVKRSVSAPSAGEVFMMREGLAECEWISGVLESIIWYENRRQGMQTLRTRCRWVPHERMVVDALTKRQGNSVSMLRLLRDGVLSVVDEDREPGDENSVP